ncbi:conserved hypothetical protein [Beutenbergia cavernae DSM 12333]|uniref:Spermidine synthase n=1 Tax=Beutenbergia cavernae (strain ATCC BAA-8 / DSM 12333 / CCUG 43141 / JCM 11478 / NBRC 16432 / NCIMB 13614 / HKI 0122) TaxID=471853 RepID=C5BW74_BEUC1|nr:fused MFS/spermidine synthase [Beutenbergia cavernae]ACQ80675.1 conserved hypothetical protein [Beutenbergia cavernae DSM 12333]
MSSRRSRQAPALRPDALPSGETGIDTGTVELERDPDRPNGVMVYVNGVESSYVDLADAEHLEFEYMQQMRLVIDALHPAGSPVRAVHLGGAACAFPRAIARQRPRSRQLVVELDAELARLAREWFDLPRAPELRVRTQDAREAVSTLRSGEWDAVVRDVFTGNRVPTHVRTVEFVTDVARTLADDGVYLANGVDSPPLRETRREVATVRDVFDHVALAVEPAIWRGRRFGNVVVIGAHVPLPLEQLRRGMLALPLPVRLVTGDELRTFAGGALPWRDAPVSTDGTDPAAAPENDDAARPVGTSRIDG